MHIDMYFSAMITTISSTKTDIASDGTPPPPPPPCTETFEEVDNGADDNFAKDVPDNADMHFAYATTEGNLIVINVTIIFNVMNSISMLLSL